MFYRVQLCCQRYVAVLYREREIWISAALIPGKNNTQADRESRVFIDNKRWNCLRPDIFQQGTKVWFNHLLTSLSLS